MMPSTVMTHVDEGERLPRSDHVGVGHVRRRNTAMITAKTWMDAGIAPT